VSDKPGSDFERAAAEQPSGNVVAEFWYLLRSTKKWWLLPIILALLLIGLFAMMSGTAFAPFIYTLF
jgi:hypothetical protein